MSNEEILIKGIGEIAKEVISFVSSSSEHLCNTKIYRDNIDDICANTIEQLSIETPVVINTSIRRTYLIGEVFIDCNTNLTMIVKNDSKSCANCNDCYYNDTSYICPECSCGSGKYHFELKSNEK